MSEQEVLNLIRQWIIANGNNEITADVLRPILEKMVEQPNDLIGDINNLSTDNKTNLVAAINDILNQYSESNFAIHTGTGTPLETPPLEYSIGDFYVHNDGVLRGFYQYTGETWVRITNKNNTNVVEIFTGMVPTVGQTTTLQEVATHLNEVGFVIQENEIVVLSAGGKLNTSPAYISYFFARNHTSGEWGTGTANGAITADDLIINMQEVDVSLLEAEATTITVGDIGASSIWDYLNANPEPSLDVWNLEQGIIYFFKYIQNSQERTALYEGMQPAQLGSDGSHVVGEGDFSIVSDESSVTKQYVDDQDAEVFQNMLTELGYYIPKSDIVDALTSTASDKPISANQGRILKGFIDSINAILSSDDISLDELQEIVDYIQQNREDLSNLSISNIAGLVNALAEKQDIIPYTPANDSEVIKGVRKADGTLIAPNAQREITLPEFSEGEGSASRSRKEVSYTTQYTVVASDFTDKELNFTGVPANSTINVIINEGVCPNAEPSTGLQIIVHPQSKISFSGTANLTPQAGAALVSANDGSSAAIIGVKPTSSVNDFGVFGSLKGDGTGTGGESYDDTEIKADIADHEQRIQDLEDNPSGGQTYGVFTNSQNGLVPAPNSSGSGYSVAAGFPAEGETLTEGESIEMTSVVTQTAGTTYSISAGFPDEGEVLTEGESITLTSVVTQSGGGSGGSGKRKVLTDDWTGGTPWKEEAEPTSEPIDISGKLDKTARIKNFWTGTEAEYNAISNKSNTTIYFIEE